MRQLVPSIIFILVFSCPAFSQTNIDSLWGVWNDPTKADTSRIKSMDEIIRSNYLYKIPDSAIHYAIQQYEFAASKGLKKQMGMALMLQGIAHSIKSNFTEALDFFERALAINIEIGYKVGIGSSYRSIGVIHYSKGDYVKALEYNKLSLEVLEETDDKQEIAKTAINTGMVYKIQGELQKAKEAFELSLIAFQKLEYKSGIASAYQNIGEVFRIQGDYRKAIDYYQKALKINEEIDDQFNIPSCLRSIGNIYSEQGEYPKALNYYESSLAILEKISDQSGIANTLSQIGTIYSMQKEYAIATSYFERTLKIFEETGNTGGVATALNQLGANFHQQLNYEKALEYYNKSLAIYEQYAFNSGIAMALHNIGNVYQGKNEPVKALDFYNRGLKMFESVPEKSGIVNSLTDIGIVYFDQKNYSKAIQACKNGLAIAEEMKTLNEQYNACRCLYLTYKGMGNGNEALAFHEKMNSLDDSLKANETTKKLQQMEFQKLMLADSIEFAKIEVIKDLEIEKQQSDIKSQRIALASASGGLLLVLVLAFTIYKGKKKSDELLLNILPYETAQELKQNGFAKARHFEHTTVLFTDFKGFTNIAERLSPEEVVTAINECFSAFDRIAGKHEIEKIKTIGDAYMAAGGLSVADKDSAEKVVNAALEMQTFIVNLKKEKGENGFEMRIGIHTGPVVAGIVGIKKFQYDIWGDTVNIASRIESSGEVGKVNISETTYQLVKDQFKCEHRGKIQAKGKGEIDMYFVASA